MQRNNNDNEKKIIQIINKKELYKEIIQKKIK